jgi:predicted nucleic acid-binding protein
MQTRGNRVAYVADRERWLNEFVNVCRRKLKLDWKEIEERLAVVKALVHEVAPLSLKIHEKAVELARDHALSFYDALMIAAALSLNCRRFLTEDMQHGRAVGALTIENPFGDP